MPSIGSRSFITLRGEVEQFGETVEDVTRPGQDGVAFRKVGERGPVFEMVSTVDTASAIAAQALYETYKGDQASLVTITDDKAQTHSNYIILEVRKVSIKYTSMIVGDTVNVASGAAAYMLVCAWSLRAAGDPNA